MLTHSPRDVLCAAGAAILCSAARAGLDTKGESLRALGDGADIGSFRKQTSPSNERA
jgi:hypothetical protein